MKYLLILNYIYLAIALYGCSVDNPPTEYNYTEEQVSDNGLTLKPSSNLKVSFGEINAFYEQTMTCMGMTAPGPTIWFVDFWEYFFNSDPDRGIGGWGLFGSGTIWINTYQARSADAEAIGIRRDSRTDSEALKHEMIHHILWSNDADWSHDNPMFKLCGVGVATYN